MKNKIYIAIICAFSIVFAVSSGFLIKHYYDSAKQAEMYDNLIEVVETEPEDTQEPMNYSKEKTFIPEYQELYLQNNDMVGWIKIEDTKINYPVMQSKDNPNFYLKHGFDKAYTDYGCPYVQENCDMELPSDNIIIYGHHILSIGKNTAYALVNSGVFHFVKVGGHYRISKKSFDRWLDNMDSESSGCQVCD